MAEIMIIAVKLVITFIAAMVFGYERQRSHKPVGFGTFIFVSLGACALGVLAVSNFLENGFVLLGAIVTGIGFLGAGALIKNSDKVFGFTTASAIWLFAIVGLIIGIGQYGIAAILYALVWVVVFSDKILEHYGIGSYQKKIIIQAKLSLLEAELQQELESFGISYRLLSVHIDKNEKQGKTIYLVEGSRDNLNHLMQKLVKHDSIISCGIE